MDCSTARLPCLSPTSQTHVHQVGDAIPPSHPLLSPSPPAYNLPQHQGLFQWLSSSHQVTKVLDLQLQPSVLPMNIQDWFLLGLTPCSQRDSEESSPTSHSKAPILQCSVFFIVHLSHPHITTGKTMAFTRWTFVGKVMSLLFHMLCRFVIAFLPRNNIG